MTSIRSSGASASDGEQGPVMSLPPQIVFFGWDEAILNDAARAQVREAADNYRGEGVQVRLEGHTDRSGSADYNIALSERRAAAVRNYLLALGIAPTAITTKAWGEARPQVETPNGIREPLNRRVEIILGSRPD